MVKKLQALKAKKGFTLVELIVVIAIIGVLAAILVPTLLGVVTKSRVTSADSTASSIRTTINNYMTNADADGYGMKANKSNVNFLQIEVNAAGEWTLKGLTANYYNPKVSNTSEVSWGANSAKVSANMDRNNCKGDPANFLLLEIANDFPSLKRASIVAVMKGGENCAFVAYTTNTADAAALSNDISDCYNTSGDVSSVASWNGKNAGISKNGYTVGTNPKVDIK